MAKYKVPCWNCDEGFVEPVDEWDSDTCSHCGGKGFLSGAMMAALPPLPSFIRASAQDAGNMSMRKACRTKWNDDDWNAMCETQDRLVRACYGRPGDHNNPEMCFIRFRIAEKMEREGKFSIKSSLDDIHQKIEEAIT